MAQNILGLSDIFRDAFNNAARGGNFDALETPVPLVDLDIAERNITRWQAQCDRLGIKNRPHIKTHKLPLLAQQQIVAGAGL